MGTDSVFAKDDVIMSSVHIMSQYSMLQCQRGLHVHQLSNANPVPYSGPM